MRGESASIIMIAGANCDWNEVRQLSNEHSDFTRLFHPGLGFEHVEQITGIQTRRSLVLVRSANETSEGGNEGRLSEEASWFREKLVQGRRNVIIVAVPRRTHF